MLPDLVSCFCCYSGSDSKDRDKKTSGGFYISTAGKKKSRSRLNLEESITHRGDYQEINQPQVMIQKVLNAGPSLKKCKVLVLTINTILIHWS